MALTAVTVAIIIGAVLLLWYFSNINSSKKLNLPPGPRGLPFIGNVFDLLFTTKKFHEVIRDWALKYGSIFSFTLLGTRIYIISDLKLVQEAFEVNQNINTRLAFEVRNEITNSSGTGK